MIQADTVSLPSFVRVLGRVRRRWQIRRVLEGLAVALALTILAAFAAVLIMDHFRFQEAVTVWARLVVYATGTAALLAFVGVRPWRGTRSGDVARYLESLQPKFDALVVSAAEMVDCARWPRGVDYSEPLVRRLLNHAAASLTENDPARSFDLRRSRRALIGIGIVLIVAGMTVAWGPPSLRYGLALLIPNFAPAPVVSPYVIDVEPGDVQVMRGADQRVTAGARGFDPAEATLWLRPEGQSEWRSTRMSPIGDPRGFEAFLFDLSASTAYYVESESVRSPEHRVEVLSWPTVERVDLVYTYPPRTGRPSELVPDGGDIRAVKGTRVEVRITPSEPSQSGQLVLDDGTRLHLEASGEVLAATLDVQRDGHYRVELPVQDGRLVPASAEYRIVTFDDGLPRASVEQPARDIRVTSVEEVELALRGTDDVAVRELELVVSVNGGEEQILDLVGDRLPEPNLESRYVLFLEEHELSPGDLVAYYLRAGDSAGDDTRADVTDIFFMEVRPFDREYRDSGGSAAGGGGAGQASQEGLAAQQRAMVVALFKLNRDRERISEDTLRETIDTLKTAQERIRERVDAIVRRLRGRQVVRLNAGYSTMAEELPEASAAMVEVERLLPERQTAEALPHAREALLHLQRADAAFRQVQVARGGRGGDAGRGDGSDLANLFRLEMDRFRNPYEHVQRGQWNSPKQELEETMDRLRELAHRQQREVERAALRGTEGPGGADSQESLAEAVDELIRRLERLTRNRANEDVAQSLQALRAAAAAMRRNAQGSDSNSSRQALDRLREAQRRLDTGDGTRLAQDIQRARAESASLAERQHAIHSRISEALEEGRLDKQWVDRLREQKATMIADTRELESTLRKLSETAVKQRHPARVSESLHNAERAAAQGELVKRLRQSRGNLWSVIDEETARLEEQISGVVDRVDRSLEAASRAAGGTGEDRDQSLQALRDAARDLDTIARRLNRAATDGPAGRGVRSAGSGEAADGGGQGFADLDFRDLELFREALRAGGAALDQLRGQVLYGRRETGDIDAVVAGLRDLGDSGSTLGEMRERHARLLEDLKRIEHSLRDEADEEPSLLQAERRAEAGPPYRDIVGEYYRRLSESSAR